jgi:hypothetical protein
LANESPPSAWGSRCHSPQGQHRPFYSAFDPDSRLARNLVFGYLEEMFGVLLLLSISFHRASN